MTLTPNTQAILLLTAPLVAGRGDVSTQPLTMGEYNRLTRILRDQGKQPCDLLLESADPAMELCGHQFERQRLDALLARGFLLSQAVERWTARNIWVISRADPVYPRRLKVRLKEYAPPLLYGCGDVALLEKGGLAVVGSRHVDEALVSYTEDVGRLAAEARLPLVSGGAKGIDRAAINGALQKGGQAVAVMADSLERAAVAHENREPLMDRRLVAVSPFDPAAGFNVGNAMQRNKVIYALADAALVVTSDYEKGGTWAGAVEQLEKFRLVPVFIRAGEGVGRGNEALLKRGGMPWPAPAKGTALEQMLADAVKSMAVTPRQETLEFSFHEKSPPYRTKRKRPATSSPETGPAP